MYKITETLYNTHFQGGINVLQCTPCPAGYESEEGSDNANACVLRKFLVN